MLLVCLECGKSFYEEDLKLYIEKHGFTSPPYEEYYACPYCAGAYEEADDLD